jgi:hypothetical protein
VAVLSAEIRDLREEGQPPCHNLVDDVTGVILLVGDEAKHHI